MTNPATKTKNSLDRSAQEWQTTFDSIEDPIILLAADHRIIRANRAFADTVGLGVSEVIGRHCYEVVHGTNEPFHSCPHRQTVALGRPVTEEFLEPRLGVFIEASTSPIFDDNGKCLGSVHIIKNIHQRKLAEAALRQANETLETKVSARTAELEEAHRNILAEVDLRRTAEERSRALSIRLLRVQEEERRGIARELHDQIGQGLTVAKLMVSRADRKAPEELRPTLKELSEQIAEIIRQVRSLSLSLRPGVLDDLGLVPALEWLFKQLHTQADMKVEFDCQPVDELPPDVATAAFRVVQEALTNVMRHSGVKEARVHLSGTGGVLFACVADRGNGFDAAALAPGQSTGLSAMGERAALLGGVWECRSVVGRGTAILLTLPLPADPKS